MHRKAYLREKVLFKKQVHSSVENVLVREKSWESARTKWQMSFNQNQCFRVICIICVMNMFNCTIFTLGNNIETCQCMLRKRLFELKKHLLCHLQCLCERKLVWPVRDAFGVNRCTERLISARKVF